MSSIYIGTSLARAGSTEKIEFEDASVVTNTARIMESSVVMTVNDTRIRNPSRNVVATFQDTGLQGVDFTITGSVLNPQDARQVVRNLRNFGARDKITAELPYGVFGVALDKFYGEYDVAPTSERGLVVLESELARVAERPSVLGFVVRLGFAGTLPPAWRT